MSPVSTGTKYCNLHNVKNNFFEVRREANVSACLIKQWSGCESHPTKIKEEGCEEGKQPTEDEDSNRVCVLWHVELRSSELQPKLGT